MTNSLPVYAKIVEPGSYRKELHFYPKAVNAILHPTVEAFFALGSERIALRYCNLNRNVDRQTLKQLMAYKPAYFRWAGMILKLIPLER